VALAMTYAGARGDTEREMASALRFGLPQASLHKAFNATDLALQGRAQELPEAASGDGFALRVTNGDFLQKGRSFQDAYLDVLAQQYDAGLYLADFAADPERERSAINTWVLDRTEQRIDELLPQGSIGSDVAFVLVNAIYFKASWFEKFDPKDTMPGTFHAPAGDVQVQMMHRSVEQYVRGDGYQAVELSYISPAVRALFILPDEGQLAALEAKLERAWFDQLRQSLGRASVSLSLPRFRFDAEIQLRDALQALGMQRAFAAGAADFSGMSGSPGDLYIDQVYHKAFVAVDEEGTEAAAATAVVGRDVSLTVPVVLTFDRPFLFVIYDEPTGQILFMGRLSQPSE
jgi:serpin B